MSIELAIGLSIITLLVGGLIGYLIRGRGGATREKVAELEAQLEASQSELSDYREEVVQQFSDTAEKFKTLDESYHALHRQLATSAVALCGDQGTPLLTATSEPLLTESQDGEEIIVGEPDVGEASSETSDTEADIEAKEIPPQVEADEKQAEAQNVSPEDAVTADADEAPEAVAAEETTAANVEVELEPDLEPNLEEVPTLTENAQDAIEPVEEERKKIMP